jgi:hypothetical protein
VAVEDVLYRRRGDGNVRLVLETSVPTIVTVTYMDQARAADMRALSRKEF